MADGDLLLDPHIIPRGSFPKRFTRIENTSRLDEHQPHLMLGVRFVLYAFGHDVQLTLPQSDAALAKVDSQLALNNEERLVRICMGVPDEVSLQANDLELVIVHLGNNSGRPLFAEEAELLFNIDGVAGIGGRELQHVGTVSWWESAC